MHYSCIGDNKGNGLETALPLPQISSIDILGLKEGGLEGKYKGPPFFPPNHPFSNVVPLRLVYIVSFLANLANLCQHNGFEHFWFKLYCVGVSFDGHGVPFKSCHLSSSSMFVVY